MTTAEYSDPGFEMLLDPEVASSARKTAGRIQCGRSIPRIIAFLFPAGGFPSNRTMDLRPRRAKWSLYRKLLDEIVATFRLAKSLAGNYACSNKKSHTLHECTQGPLTVP